MVCLVALGGILHHTPLSAILWLYSKSLSRAAISSVFREDIELIVAESQLSSSMCTISTGSSMLSRSSGMSLCLSWLSILMFLFKTLVGCSTSWQTPDGVSESMLIGCLFVTNWLLFAVSSFRLSCEVVAMMCSCGSTGVDWCAGIIDMRSLRGLVLSAGVMEISCGSCSWFCFFGEWVIRWMILVYLSVHSFRGICIFCCWSCHEGRWIVRGVDLNGAALRGV